jgi:putative tryptophan/tyrosine transport system substrate-binding protein
MTDVGGQKSEVSQRIALSALLFALSFPGAMLFGLCLSAEAQQPGKIARIGYLSANSPSATTAGTDAFRKGLRERGYSEGKNITIEWRYAEEKRDRLPALAFELVRLKVDVIVTGGPSATRAAKEATDTIPIVMTFDSDPVANQFVASLARPDRNITGLSSLAPEISGKQIELLKEIVPRLSTVAVLGSSTQPGNAQAVKETELAAKAFKVKFQYLDVLTPKDLEGALPAASKGRTDAVLVLQTPILFSGRAQLAELAAKNHLPAMYPRNEYVEEGGLMFYGTNVPDLYRRAATYVDKILKGANPGELPVEQPTKFELVINLKAAKQIGLTIPQRVLARADKVIK